MAESSLSMGYPELRAKVGAFLGYGRDPDAWGEKQDDDVADVLESGLRQFYYPPPVEPRSGAIHERVSFRWSFLHPVGTFDTVADTWEYSADDDFGSFESNVTFDPDEGYGALRTVSASRIREMRQTHDSSGIPRFIAVEPLESDGSDGQRFQFLLWPTPDAVYTLTYNYHVLLPKLTTDNPYPLGGMPHAETVLESCLAVAESRLDDESNLHQNLFRDRLRASIQQDLANKPDFLGTMMDRSDGQAPPRRGTHNVTYDGVLYE